MKNKINADYAFIDFFYCWLHLSITQVNLILLSVCAAILHSSFFILHLKTFFA